MAHLLIGLSSVIFLPKQVSRSKIMIILYQATEKSVPSKDKYHTSHITVQHCPGTIRRKQTRMAEANQLPPAPPLGLAPQEFWMTVYNGTVWSKQLYHYPQEFNA